MEPILLNDDSGEVAALELKVANVESACPKWIIEVRRFRCLRGATIHPFLYPFFFIIFSAFVLCVFFLSLAFSQNLNGKRFEPKDDADEFTIRLPILCLP